MRKDRDELVLIRVRIVAMDLEDLTDEALSLKTVDVNEKIERVSDVRLDGSMGKLDTALERQVLESG
jgi:hypothetical protein